MFSLAGPVACLVIDNTRPTPYKHQLHYYTAVHANVCVVLPHLYGAS